MAPVTPILWLRSRGDAVVTRCAALIQIIGSLEQAGITVEDVAVRRPTLDEAFLHLTGQQSSPDSAVEAPVPPAEGATP